MSGYSHIPDKVFLLFDEIMHGGNPVELLEPEERSMAQAFCWFHDPPLLERSKRNLTQYGLAAYAWKKLQDGGTNPKPKAKRKKSNPYAKKNVNARMLDELSHNNEAYYWTQGEWAEHLDCSGSSISATHAWQVCKMQQERSKDERGKRKDRRRRAKGSDQRRASEDD